MEAENKLVNMDPTSRVTQRYNNPWVIGAGALGLGFMIGSGQWTWLRDGFVRVFGSVGNLVLTYASTSIQQSNPKFFESGKGLKH